MTRLGDLSRWIDESAGVLLGLDFDGTLAPIVDDPTESALTSSTRAALEQFARTPSVAPAVVSGRGRDDLMQRVGVDGVAYAGNHGLELAYGGTETVHPEAARQRSTIDRLCDELDSRLDDVPGCTVENKGVTATVHFRRAADDTVPAIVSTVEAVVSDVPAVELTEGKQIRELRPSVDWDKGEAMRLLSDATPDDWRAMYLGDDTTDEDAFRAIQPDGIGVKVVDPAVDARTLDTAAQYRLDGQEEVPSLLAWIGMSFDAPTSVDTRSDPWTEPVQFANPPVEDSDA
jgi:trehalose 6-phosphate phosphatase